MAWRKRRRFRLSNVLSYLCTFCCVAFVLGNVIMLREGFVQLYVSTVGAGHSGFIPDPGGPSQLGYPYPPQQSWGSPGEGDLRIHLPASALAAETRLRKLMEDGEERIRNSYHDNNHNNNGLNHRVIMHRSDVRTLGEPDAYGGEGLSSASLVTSRGGVGVGVAGGGVVSTLVSDVRRILNVTSDCHGVWNVTQWSVLGSGFTKLVYRGKYRNKMAAIKTVDIHGNDVTTCLTQNRLAPARCYDKAASKILKETVLLKGLDHPNIVKVIGYCVPANGYNGQAQTQVAMVTEVGETIDVIKLLQMSWEDRLRISYGLTKLIHYLAHSPFGSALLSDYQRQQFVLVDGVVKLTDVDDVQFEDPRCTSNVDCDVYYSSVNFTMRSPCISGRCVESNERKNIFNTARHFTSFLLPHGAPSSLRAPIGRLVDAYSNVTMTSSGLLVDLEDIVNAFKNGTYLRRAVANSDLAYRVIPAGDLPGLHDYRCGFTLATAGCTLSVFDLREAEGLCDSDPHCRAFVLSDQRTWTGRLIVHLKNGTRNPSVRPGRTLYLKPGV